MPFKCVSAGQCTSTSRWWNVRQLCRKKPNFIPLDFWHPNSLYLYLPVVDQQTVRNVLVIHTPRALMNWNRADSGPMQSWPGHYRYGHSLDGVQDLSMHACIRANCTPFRHAMWTHSDHVWLVWSNIRTLLSNCIGNADIYHTVFVR